MIPSGLPGFLLAVVLALIFAELGSRLWIRRFSGCYVFLPGWKVDVRVDEATFPEQIGRAHV